MKIGIVGLPFVGKTTIFNALTGAEAETGTYAGGQKSNISSVQVPDPRLDALAEIFQPERVMPTAIDYIDVAGVSKGDLERGGFQAGFIAELREVDALAHVVRVFGDTSVPHIDGAVDPARDIETLDLELAFADLQIIEKRLERLERDLRVSKDADLEYQFETLKQCEQALQEGIAIRELELSKAAERAIRGYQFLTRKPLLIILNVGENQSETVTEIESQFEAYTQKGNTDLFILSAQIEMEIAQLDPEEAEIFLTEMGLPESALNRFIQASYHLLGLITFLTVAGSNEVRAWTVQSGTTAVEAAGTVHTDMARGFIRAETIFWQELVDLGGFTQAKDAGRLRLEGKDYIVQDGDVLTIRFNV
ncbi:MAG: redox-regulated ATPase YchF [Candidatus Poribacteria bacterium]|jgi:hypothetical protein|nr:redox-regulated ATPase YchF [Candidatus Poribacteria bacterium]MDP6749634.1 redox-regulated ATPase YchF [Candidatus Poribacteria bacterium]MDP6996034.1 redox-regulated ATPase YchF [Candidatus Poribacteria bacterium]